MATLFRNELKNQAIEILEWAYGRDAGIAFLRGLMSGRRIGQSFMNVLRLVDPESYKRITGSMADPFYNDNKLPEAIDMLTSK